MGTHRIGLVVPSSNVTVETELPALLRRQTGEEFTFHASRMRMTAVSPEGLRAMNVQRERCVMELGDASTDTLLYACLVALMAGDLGEHRRVEGLVAEQLATGESLTRVRSSAGALVEALQQLGAKRIALVTPYMRPLAEKVVAYLHAEGFEVADWRALEVEDNHAVGCIAGEDVMAAARSLNLTGVDALIISACVQMPSLDVVQLAESELGVPTISAATAGAASILRSLGITPDIDGAGSFLRQANKASVVPNATAIHEPVATN